MASGTQVVLFIIAGFLAVLVFLMGAVLLRIDEIRVELRRRLSHIDNKLSVLEATHARTAKGPALHSSPRTGRIPVAFYQDDPKGRPSR